MGKHLLFSFPFVFFFSPPFFFSLAIFFHLLLRQNTISAKIHLDSRKPNRVWVLGIFKIILIFYWVIFFFLFSFCFVLFLLPKFPFLKSRQVRTEAQSSGLSKLTNLCHAVWELSHHTGRKPQIWVPSQTEWGVWYLQFFSIVFLFYFLNYFYFPFSGSCLKSPVPAPQRCPVSLSAPRHDPHKARLRHGDSQPG